MELSESTVFAFVLHTGVAGRLTSGRVEKDAAAGIHVFNHWGDPLHYLHPEHLRSWCLFGPAGPVPSWNQIHPDDRALIFGGAY